MYHIVKQIELYLIHKLSKGKEKYKNIYAEIVYNPELWKWSDKKFEFDNDFKETIEKYIDLNNAVNSDIKTEGLSGDNLKIRNKIKERSKYNLSINNIKEIVINYNDFKKKSNRIFIWR